MTAEENDVYCYDAFISYSDCDKEWVRGWLLPQLEKAGLRVCIDFRCFEPGAPILTEMERAVVESRKTLLVLTPNYLASEWAEFENILASTLDPAARQRRVIPLLLRPCELPLRIHTLYCLDFTQPSQVEFQLQRLIGAIKGEPIRHPPRLPTPWSPTPRPAGCTQLPLSEIVAHLGQRVREWSIKTLRDPLWQSIGGAVAVLALSIAIGARIWPDLRVFLASTRSTATPTSTWTPTPTTPTPTPTLTPTPTQTPTYTSTPTPTSTPSCPIRLDEAIPYDGHAGSSLETAEGADSARPDAIKITFENPNTQSFSSWVIPLHTCDATGSESLSFWVRGENGGEQFEVGIRDSTTEAGHEPKVKQTAPAEWQQVFTSLQEFQEQDLSSLENFSLGFSYDLGSGTIYVDGFTFSPP